MYLVKKIPPLKVSIPLEQGGVFRRHFFNFLKAKIQFQSLWNRAGSFDLQEEREFLAGIKSQSLWNRARSFDLFHDTSCVRSNCVSIPLEQGKVFRRTKQKPCGFSNSVSIPLEQGRVFRHNAGALIEEGIVMFQSLWNRAGSFDGQKATHAMIGGAFQSLWNRAGSFDYRKFYHYHI